MADDRIMAARIAYLERFGNPGPEPFGVDEGLIAQVLEKAVADGAPVPDDFDWWGSLPPDAVA